MLIGTEHDDRRVPFRRAAAVPHHHYGKEENDCGDDEPELSGERLAVERRLRPE